MKNIFFQIIFSITLYIKYIYFVEDKLRKLRENLLLGNILQTYISIYKILKNNEELYSRIISITQGEIKMNIN